MSGWALVWIALGTVWAFLLVLVAGLYVAFRWGHEKPLGGSALIESTYETLLERRDP